MWYKVNQLSRENLTQHQIALKLGVDRSTVRRYQRMTEDDFNSMLQREAGRHACKLDRYREFIVKQLQDYPFLSSPQILDHLKEHFEDFGSVSDKTVYNYVMRVREEEGIPKSSEHVRQMHKIPDCEYGEQAQVDYGEKWVMSDSGRRVKVHFFAMTLCRSVAHATSSSTSRTRRSRPLQRCMPITWRSSSSAACPSRFSMTRTASCSPRRTTATTSRRQKWPASSRKPALSLSS